MNKQAKSLLLSSIIITLGVLTFVYFVLAVNTSITLNGQSSTLTYFTKSNSLFTFSITAAGIEGINRTTITLSAGVMPINNTNSTTAIAQFQIINNKLIWNQTLAIGSMINGSDTKDFLINLTAVDGVYNITIDTFDNSSNGISPANSTNISVVFDSTIPRVIYTSPAIGANLTSRNIRINVSTNDSYLNKTIISLAYRNLTVITSSTNNTNYNSNAMNISIVLTLTDDGNYTINTTAFDNAGNANTSYRNITVDSLGPAITIITPANYTNLTSVIFNITAIDATLNVTDSCWMTLNDGALNFTMTKNSNSFNYTNASIAEGNYLARYYCNDTFNNLNNSEVFNFTVDRTSPALNATISVSVTSTTATITYYSNESVNATINYGTGYSLGTISSKSTYDYSSAFSLSSLVASTTYYYNITICDQAGNCYVNETNSFTTSAATEETSSNGAGVVTTITPTLNLNAGYTKLMIVAEQLNFKIGTESHSVFIKSLMGDTLTLKISSTPQIVTLKVGEEKKIDLTNDSYYDLFLRFNSIKSGAANLTIKTINELIPSIVNDTVVLDQEVPIGNTDTKDTTSKSGLNFGLIIGIIVVVIIIAFIIWYLLQRRKRYSIFGY
jgi:hypothetical protein